MKADLNTRGLLGRRAFIGGSVTVLAGARGALAQDAGSINERMQGDFVPVHDPCIIKQGDTSYLFCTTSRGDAGGFVACRRSRDLVNWEKAGFVFAQLPEWAREAVPGTKGIWAPDISFFNGRYHLYYSVSTFGSNHSVIGLATNKTLDPAGPGFEWVDRGPVVQSRKNDDFNAIDPNLCVDREGKCWLSWGSFWSGLKMARIDPATGKRMEGARKLHSIASRPVARGEPSPIEAPFIIARGNFYYLFASFDFCCRGARSNYFVVCGRAREITGPYLDVQGRSLLEGGGSIVIQGDERFKGTGHNAVLRDGEQDYLVYHAYDTQADGKPTLRISPIYWTPDEWPRAQL
ncbi:MAG TPA: arabinan endo-1,5-alpha-L-arabinosidase [Steroidobacteraceae bacterium]|nr:arabinan endo-1,5-alpha-L-arabinosidase [Steroidobacteraceae bacterium]